MVFRACRLLSFQSPRQDFSFPFQHNYYNKIFIISQILIETISNMIDYYIYTQWSTIFINGN